MKKFISMFAFAAMIVFGAFALASCGGSDDDDPVDPTPTPTPTPSTDYSYQFTVEVNKDCYESMKTLYPDLAITYTIPGKDAKTVALTSEPITVDEKTSEEGYVPIVFKGKLDTSKVDPAKKYSFDVNISYSVVSGKRIGIRNPSFTELTGQEVIDMFSDLSVATALSSKL